jgi:hypothetical protein
MGAGEAPLLHTGKGKHLYAPYKLILTLSPSGTLTYMIASSHLQNLAAANTQHHPDL